MQKGIAKKYYALVWLLDVALFNVLVFLLVKSENRLDAFWTSYSFITIGFLLNLASFYLVKPNSERINPLTTFSLIYTVVALIYGIIMFFIPSAPFLVAFIPLLVMLVVFSIMGVFGVMNLEMIKSNPQKTPVVFTMSELVEYLQETQKLSSDVAVRNKINDLAYFAMSARVSSEENKELEDVEKQIYEYATFIRKNVERNEITNVFNNIEKVRKLIKEREQLIK